MPHGIFWRRVFASWPVVMTGTCAWMREMHAQKKTFWCRCSQTKREAGNGTEPVRNRRGSARSAVKMDKIPHLLVHNRRDNVGVVVVENLTAGTDLICVVTEDNSEFQSVVNQNVPLGHKVALQDLSVGDTVIKYGEDVGRIVAPVRKGDHVHTHNLKTKRW
jgi:(2R)-sulfolactate sulfo-lyase subunit alpha